MEIGLVDGAENQNIPDTFAGTVFADDFGGFIRDTLTC